MSNVKKGKLFVVSGCSGAGKTSIVEAVLKVIGYNFKKIVTYTSRLPRENEINGVDYFFVTKSKFEDLVKNKFFLEWSKDYDDFYGTPKNLLSNLNKGQSLIVIPDVRGAKNIKKLYPKAILIWIEVADVNELRGRIEQRALDDLDSMEKRISLSSEEIKTFEGSVFFSHKIVNDDFSYAVKNLIDIVELNLSQKNN